MIKLFSQTNKDAKKRLKPDMGLRSWNDITTDEKNKIWLYLEGYFFNKTQKIARYDMLGNPAEKYYEFYGDSFEKKLKQKAVLDAIFHLNEEYKARSYAENYLKNSTLNAACLDFYNIFIENDDEAVVFELLSFYGNFLFTHSKDHEYVYQKENETDEEFKKRKINAKYKMFDNFASRLNDIFEQFGINYYLTRKGFIPRQDKKITEEIYEPVLSFFSDSKWKEINRDLQDAFSGFRKKTPKGYSSCITHTVSALQAFLQILVNGKIGKGDISQLIPEAQKKGLIPDDKFSTKIFKDIQSILMEERQIKANAHPKKEYANEKSALLVLNLTMIFLQHCIQN